MPTFEMTIILKEDGVDVPGFPVVSRVSTLHARSADESFGSSGVFDSFQTWPVVSVAVLQSLDRVTTVRFNNQSDAGVKLNPGGLVVLFNVDVRSGLTTNVKVQNATGLQAQIKTLFAGDNA